MDWFSPQFRRNPNEKVHSLYYGVSPGFRSQSRLIKAAADRNRFEAERQYGPPVLQRGEGGRAAILILGGMETTRDEIEDIMLAAKEKRFKPRRGPGEIADMCRYLLEKRNDLAKYYKRNPSERPTKPRNTRRLYLPTGCRMVKTPEPGLEALISVR